MTIAIEKLLREARGTAVDEAVKAHGKGNRRAKIEWQVKRDYLERLLQAFDTLADDKGGKVVFISYSVDSGKDYLNEVQTMLEGRGYRVVTGFDSHPDAKGKVLRQILGHMSQCAVYVAILTKEIEVRPNSGETRWSPGVWTMEEKGMALALRKPFVLMVEEGVHDDYWQKTTPTDLHLKFNASNYRAIAEKLVDTVEDHYADVAMKRTSPSRVIA